MLCWNSELTSRRLFLSLSRETADHQLTPHPAYTWTFQTVAHNQSESANTFSAYAPIPELSPPLFNHSQCKFFQNSLHLASPNSLYKTAPIPGRQPRLSSPPSPAAGGVDRMPPIWFLLGLAYCSVNSFRKTFGFEGFFFFNIIVICWYK